MKKSVGFFLFVLFLVTGAVVNAQTFWAGNVEYEVDEAGFIGTLSNREFLTLSERNEMRVFETALQQNVFGPAGLRITTFGLRAANERTSAETQIVQWVLNNSIPLSGHRVGDTYRIITSRTDQWVGYIIVFNYTGNNNWSNLMFNFSAR